MKIINDILPDSLRGNNREGYVHDTTNYKFRNFVMGLANGDTMHCKIWANEVERWINDFADKSAKLGVQIFNEQGELQYDKFRIHNEYKIEERNNMDFMDFMGANFMREYICDWNEPEPVTPVNTSFYDCGDVCVVTWSDGTTTTVRYDGEGEFGENLAVAIAFIKKFHGLKMYNDLLESIDKTERDKNEADEKRREELADQEEKRAAKYRKAVKKAARRAIKRAKFEADVQHEINNEFF